mmetsp:Transcript_21140/g.28109  ORF Transcript_21140/g.28109 Transcript_21140/m.28109 type:complete len:433 (+) Transcript_21140:346-1644(+)
MTLYLTVCRFLHPSRISNTFSATKVSSSAKIEKKLPDIPPLPSRVICNEETLSQFLHKSPVNGLHIVCFDQMEPSSADNEEEDKVRLTFYADAVAEGKEQITISKKDLKWDRLKTTLAVELELEHPGPLQQPWAVFTTKGERIVGVEDVLTTDLSSTKSEMFIVESLLASNTVVLTGGGQWVWPGVKVGFKREVELYSIMPGDVSSHPNTTTIIETLSLSPLVLSVHKFLSDEECGHVRMRSEPSMKYSKVTLKDADIGKEASEWRTSQNTFLRSDGDAVMRDLEYRTASLTRVPRGHQEHLQVLRYGNTEFYSAHHDFFDPAHYRQDQNTLQLIQNGKRNRLATVFWYLSDVEEGGETIFPLYNGLPFPRSFKDCSRGLKVKPEKGKVIIFYSLDAAGHMDEKSLHGACPVKEGIKWAANKWVWNDAVGFL